MSNLTFALYVVPVGATALLCGAAMLFIRFLPKPEATAVPPLRADGSIGAELARGLVNTLTRAKTEGTPWRRDALLQELRELYAADRSNTTVRAQLARGLLTALTDATDDGMLERRDALLQELRDLHEVDRSGAAMPTGGRPLEVAG